MAELAQRVTHRIPQRDSIDHETTATNPDELEQCVCGPDWELGDGPGHLYAVHHALHGERD